ncbi:MAG: murein biosynthesis integral membrane protein MurJ [Anaerolineales bacterium]
MAQSTPHNPAAPPPARRLVRSILVVMAGFLLTKSVSFLQTIIIAAEFGAGAEYDTFVAGSLMPDYIVRLIGGGALGVAFIPVFSALLNQDNNQGAWQLASQVFNTLLLATLTLSIIVMIFAKPLVEIIVAPGLDAAQTQQTAELMRILSIASIIFSVSGIISGVLHGHNHFFLPVLAPVFQDLGLLFGVIFFIGPFGIYGLAWGTLLGAMLHFLIQVPGLLMFKVRWWPKLGWGDPQLQQVVRLMLPRIGIAVAFLINLTAITNVNSRLGEGAISAFGWGLRFIDIPQALIGTAVAIVVFPTLSALSATNRTQERLAAFSGAMRFILLASIPAMAGLILVSYDALRLLFTERESALIFTVIQVMSLAIILQSLHEILTRAFYAGQDTIRPLIYSVVATVVTVVVVFGMFALYDAQADIDQVIIEPQAIGGLTTYDLSVRYDPPLYSPWAVGGPAVGYVVVFLVECALLAWFLRRRWGDIALPEMARTAGKALLATLVMVIAVLVARAALVNAGFDTFATRDIIVRVVVDVTVGLVAFAGMAVLLRMQELEEAWRLIRRRAHQATEPSPVAGD